MPRTYFSVHLLNKYTGFDPEVMQMMFDVFKKHYPDYFKEASECIERKDWANFGLVVHRAKSAVAIMGMEEIENELEEIEQQAVQGKNTDIYASHLDNILKKVKTGVEQIQQYVDNR
ncbi:MAG: Hpt domain-containing protein [Candidatus Delongbacteria bacterium]|jgi:HPt (histidine-containing phosphotransfer) domain-containing protein|nr:Hpt domain-containing protein [Candidatus Delongbacteria bacterium]